MAKTREIVCEYYEYEGSCTKGREGTFYGKCQTCDKYNPKQGAKPNRVDNRRKKLDKIMRKERY